MAGITLEIAQARLNEYLDAESRVLAGQKTVINGIELTKADLEAIQAGITTWDRRVQSLAIRSTSSGRTQMRYGVPS